MSTFPLALDSAQAAMILGLLSLCLLFGFLALPRSDEAVRQRIAAIGGGRTFSSSDADVNARKRTVAQGLRGAREPEEDKRRKPTLEEMIAQAGLNWSLLFFYATTLISAALSFFLAFVAFRLGLITSISILVAGAFAPRLYVTQKRKKRLQAFENEFPNAIDIIVRGVRAGLPLVDCLKIIATDAQDPVRSEFKTIIEDQAIGLPIEQAVDRLTSRVPTPEANFFAIVIAIQSRTGGNLSEALGNLSSVLRERQKMRLKIKAVSSEARASATIIGSMPFGVAGLVYLTSPKYIRILFVDPTGQTVLIVCGVWMVIGVLIMRKMINFDF